MIDDLEEQILKSCRFCIRPDLHRIIHESENFYVMLSLGPIVEGYCLLISKKHFSCCAAIPFDIQEEFKEIYSFLKITLKRVYGKCVCYEHGRTGTCLIPMEGSKHCYHAHMHFVPIETQLNEIVKKDYDEIVVENLDSYFRKYVQMKGAPYLFVDDDKSMCLYFIDKPIRRQYLRYKAAQSVNKENLWDWVAYQGWDLINSALQILPDQFKQLNK